MIVLDNIVTWGSGEPAGRVDYLYVGTNPETSQREAFARIVLTKDVKSPCGRVWSTGSTVHLPVSELRLLS